jgi:hypothetical protein
MTTTPRLPSLPGITAATVERVADRVRPTRTGGAIGVGRVLGVWLLLCGAMVGNGILREAALVPALKRSAADIVSAALGVTIILAVTRPFLHRFAGQPGAHPARVAGAWLGLTVAFEFLFGHYVDGKSWGELLANYAVWRGKLWPLVLLTVAIAPFLWTRWWPPQRR